MKIMDVIQILQQNVKTMQKAIKILSSAKTGKPRRRMSAAGRRRIAAAQRKRWAKIKAAKK